MTVRGLVLGAGGVLGAAWTIGALAALESERGLSPGDFDTIQGTSAGSVLAALLASGVQMSELLAHEQDQPVHTGPLAQRTFDHAEATGGALDPKIPLRLVCIFVSPITTKARRLGLWREACMYVCVIEWGNHASAAGVKSRHILS